MENPEGLGELVDGVGATLDEVEMVLEPGNILFLDMVHKASDKTLDLRKRITSLQSLVRETPDFRRGNAHGTLVSAHVSDGIALVFLRGDLDAPLRCAIQLARLIIEGGPRLCVRMGVHAGPFTRYLDFEEHTVLSGAGIAVAAELARLGEEGHILVSERMATDLRDDARWADHFHSLGVHDLGERRQIGVYNFFMADVGNQESPGRLSAKPLPSVAPSVHEIPVVATPQAETTIRPEPPMAPEPEPNRPEPLAVRVLAVTYTRTGPKNGEKESLAYAPQSMGEHDAVSSPVAVDFNLSRLRQDLDSLKSAVDELTRLAIDRRSGGERGEVGVERAAGAISRQVLPRDGLVRLLGEGVHPQFTMFQDLVVQTPWEVLEECSYRCPRCSTTIKPEHGPALQPPFCSRCGEGMVPSGGKLVEILHMSHIVNGQQRREARGRRFVLLEDPTGDLCSADADPDGLCAGHVDELHKLLGEQGYEVSRLPGANVSRQRLLDVLTDRSVVGIYYFGHGYHDGDEGFLQLGDGPFAASQLKDVQPTTPFIFLNACEAAAGGHIREGGDAGQSVAMALAAPSHWRNVIAPIWPVVNTQAAETALAFFKHAAVSSLGEAMTATRRLSLERYRAGKADLPWFLYRFFGSQRQWLPSPEQAKPPSVSTAASRAFDLSDNLRTEVFAFPIEEILVRAGQCRTNQARERISVTDLIAGMVMRGELTRYVLLRGDFESELDETVAPLLRPAHADRSVASASGRGPDVLRRASLQPQVGKLLVAADREAQRRPGTDQRITERDVLMRLLEEEAWNELRPAGFGSTELREILDAVLLEREVDENGQITLAGLGQEARRVLETAHKLAQQRGVSPISNRLMLAAFLSDAQGHAASACRQANLNPSEMLERMLASYESGQEEASPPQSFGLSPELCDRIVSPMLKAARRDAHPWEPVTEARLFSCFIEQASPEFKLWMASEGIDLDALAAKAPALVPPEEDTRWTAALAWASELDASARHIIGHAHVLSQSIGSFPIRNAILLASFLEDESRFLVRLLRALAPHLDPASVRDRLIERAGIRRAPTQYALDEEACRRAVAPMVAKALERRAGKPVDEATLFIGFCLAAPRELKARLAGRDFSLDLDALSMVADAFRQQVPAPASSPSVVPEVQLPAELCQGDFDDDAWRCVLRAAAMAREQGWAELRTPHLFVALLADHVPVPRLGRLSHEQERELARLALAVVPPAEPKAAAGTPVTVGGNAAVVLRRAVAEAKRKQHTRATLEDVVVAFFADGGGIIGELLGNLASQPAARAAHPVSADATASVLSSLGRDLTEKARAGQIPEIVGRDAEIENALHILQLSENANPLLLGDAGVGKTAIVEGLARRLLASPIPKSLEGARIVEVPAGALFVNTRFRGDLEQRIGRLLGEAKGNVILFLDEIHTLMAPLAGEGGADAADLFKAALARGEVRIIGATTQVEYQRTIGRDKALSRRFQVQMIGAPSAEVTTRILEARRPSLEAHHGVTIRDGAISAAVRLSGRHILDRQWPAKARDVLERACVLAASASSTVVDEDVVTSAVARITGIPIERVTQGQMAELATLPDRLNGRIVGQTDAVRVLVDAIRAGRQGLSTGYKPLGVFLFVGPPGVGKTELAKVLAEEVYGGLDRLIRFDMAELREPGSIARLVGSPPGYVGYRDGARLVDELRQHPYSVLLLDEIEHAHEDVLAIFLRLFSEGTIADQAGNIGDCRHCIVILTSNALAESGERAVGFARDRDDGVSEEAALRESAAKWLSKKIVDRVDAIVRFRSLKPDDLERIARLRLDALVGNAQTNRDLVVSVAPGVAGWLVRQAQRVDRGAARAIARMVEEHVSKPLAAWMARSGPPKGGRALVRLAEMGPEVIAG